MYTPLYQLNNGSISADTSIGTLVCGPKSDSYLMFCNVIQSAWSCHISSDIYIIEMQQTSQFCAGGSRTWKDRVCLPSTQCTACDFMSSSAHVGHLRVIDCLHMNLMTTHLNYNVTQTKNKIKRISAKNPNCIDKIILNYNLITII